MKKSEEDPEKDPEKKPKAIWYVRMTLLVRTLGLTPRLTKLPERKSPLQKDCHILKLAKLWTYRPAQTQRARLSRHAISSGSYPDSNTEMTRII